MPEGVGSPKAELVPATALVAPNPAGVEGVGTPVETPAVGYMAVGVPKPPSKKKSSRRAKHRRQPSKHRLKPTQEAFVAHYTTPGQSAFGNGRQAYLKVHPAATQGSAGVLASRMLDNVNVVEAVKAKVEGLGFGKDEAIEGLIWNLKTAQAHGKLTDHRESTKVYLQATGNWVEKQERTTLDETQRDAIRRVVGESLRSPN